MAEELEVIESGRYHRLKSFFSGETVVNLTICLRRTILSLFSSSTAVFFPRSWKRTHP